MMRSWRSSVRMNTVPKHTQKYTHTCHHIDVQRIHCVPFFSWHLESLVKYLNFSDDLTRVSCVWGNSKATTASFNWGSSCAIDLSACHMRTRRRRKERGWTHVYTGETISWLYIYKMQNQQENGNLHMNVYSQAFIVGSLTWWWFNIIHVWILFLVYLVSWEQARQRSWAAHCCQSSNQGKRERDVDETSCNIKPETLPRKDSFQKRRNKME